MRKPRLIVENSEKERNVEKIDTEKERKKKENTDLKSNEAVTLKSVNLEEKKELKLKSKIKEK